MASFVQPMPEKVQNSVQRKPVGRIQGLLSPGWGISEEKGQKLIFLNSERGVMECLLGVSGTG